MRLLLIRHAEPDPVNRKLTEKGRREAMLLAKAAPSLHLGTCYVSPLVRAQETASYSLAATGKTAETLDWLQEFSIDFDLNRDVSMQGGYPEEKVDGSLKTPRFWDMYPDFWKDEASYLDPVDWRNCPLARETDLTEVYDSVIGRFDELLASFGYVREGSIYRVEKENEETLTFFCHLGVICALLSHLWGVSPFTFWFHCWYAPSSVTELITEERIKGTAHFRSQRIGDVSHLYAGKEELSFSGRFCECYDQFDKRH